MAFATRDELALVVGHTIDQARADLLLDLASASVAEAAGVPIAAAADATATLTGTGNRVLLLPAWPVTDVSEVTVDGTAVSGYTWTRSGELRRTAGWTLGAEIVVTFDHGYAEAAVPDAVKGVTLEVAARALMNPQGLKSYNGDGTVVQFGDGVLDLTLSQRDRVLRALT